MMSLRKLALLTAVAAFAANGTFAAEAPFKPQSGQAGKDVVWVPTPQALVDRMLDMAKITKEDYLIDLGAGDGRTVITAAKRGTRAHGIEYNPEMVKLAQFNAQQEGVTDRATFVQADIFASDFSKATVITLFPAAAAQREASPDPARNEAGHTRGFQLVQHGRLAGGRNHYGRRRMHQLVHRL